MANKVNLKNVVWQEGKYYVAQGLNVDVSSFGKTKKEALANLQEAIELRFEDEKATKIAKVENAEIINLSLSRA
ncbi:MAG TPA: type II toxin-antitoxin system HicB family antitoxin [Candidatus Paceibacterota bacterium]